MTEGEKIIQDTLDHMKGGTVARYCRCGQMGAVWRKRWSIKHQEWIDVIRCLECDKSHRAKK